MAPQISVSDSRSTLGLTRVLVSCDNINAKSQGTETTSNTQEVVSKMLQKLTYDGTETNGHKPLIE